jgi:hypothetical protein
MHLVGFLFIVSSKLVWHNIRAMNHSSPCTLRIVVGNVLLLCIVFDWTVHEVLNQEYALPSVRFVKEMAPYGDSEIRNKCYIFDKKNIHTYVHTVVFPCFFLSCKANARVKLAKTGHGPHSTTLVCICVVRMLLFVLFYCYFCCSM